MNILIVIDAYYAVNGGGIATRYLVDGLRKRGHKVSVVTTEAGKEGIEEKNIYFVKGFTPPGLKESFKNMRFLFGYPEKKVLREAYADADIIQIDFPFYLGYGAAKLAKKMKKKVMGTFHVQPQNVLGASGIENKFLENMLFRLFNFFLFNRVPMIRCPSQFAADLLKKHGVKSMTRVVTNGILADYKPKNYDRPEWFSDNLVLLNIGRHALEKRQSLLIEGVKRSKYANKIKLILCGRGEMTEKITAQGAELPVPPYIKFVSHEEKLQLLNTSDLYVHTSTVDLESLSCLEAIGCGLPCLIVNSPRSAAPQFALDDRFTFKYEDSDSLAEKINYWYENKEALRTLKGQTLVMAEQYRFETCLDKMEELYRYVINGK